jgi:hypothetical protein
MFFGEISRVVGSIPHVGLSESHVRLVQSARLLKSVQSCQISSFSLVDSPVSGDIPISASEKPIKNSEKLVPWLCPSFSLAWQ